jgi:hypothetical protein
MLTTSEDWKLYHNYPGVISPRIWEENALKEHPILEKYFARDQFDRYVTTAALLGLSYKQYISDHAVSVWQTNLDVSCMYPDIMNEKKFKQEYMCSFKVKKDGA